MVQISSSSVGTNSQFKVSTNVLSMLLLVIATVSILVNLLFLGPLQKSTQFPEPGKSPLVADQSIQKNSLISFPTLSEEEGRTYILETFREAGVELTPVKMQALPSWKQVQEVIGPHPYIVGLEHCEAYREQVPPLERMLGSAGMFNSGTNLITHLLKQNCEIPERREQMGPHQSKESYGMRWQVPWGKHTPAHYRDAHSTQKAMKINKEWILPVVMLRNPYTWFRSTCKSPYTAKWEHRRNNPRDCPSLKDPSTGEWKGVSVKYAAGEDEHQSLAHLWNEWYSSYIRKAEFPWVAIRMEDLVFYPKPTITAVCECAGGKIRTDQDFVYIVDSAKADSRGHDASTGIYEAWIKYSKPPEPQFGFSDLDYQASVEALDESLMTAFGYRHPPSRSE